MEGGVLLRRTNRIIIKTDYGSIDTYGLVDVFVIEQFATGRFFLCYKDDKYEMNTIHWSFNKEDMLRKRDKIIELVNKGYVSISV